MIVRLKDSSDSFSSKIIPKVEGPFATQHKMLMLDFGCKYRNVEDPQSGPFTPVGNVYCSDNGNLRLLPRRHRYMGQMDHRFFLSPLHVAQIYERKILARPNVSASCIRRPKAKSLIFLETEKIPKALVDIDGQPFLHHQLELFKKNGFSNIILSLGYLGHQIENQFKDGSKYGLKIRYSYDGDHLLGTGGAVLKACADVDTPFFICYGDSYLPVNYQAIYEKYLSQNNATLMSLFKNADQFDTSNVIFENGVLRTYSKKIKVKEMTYIGYGLMITQKSIFSQYSAGETFDLATVLEREVEAGQVTGIEVFERFYEIGSHTGLEDFRKYIEKSA